MKYFKLPDLGEGLQEAEIVEWHVKEGDSVEQDQVLVSVETAKAIVEVPSPQAGVIDHLFGQPGDIIHIGEPLVQFAGETDQDSGTVVGRLKEDENDEATGRSAGAEEDHFIIGAARRSDSGSHIKATPAVRALARRFNVELDQVKPTGPHGLITTDDVERAYHLIQSKGAAEPLRGVRRAMAKNMEKAHAEVVPVSIFDDADIHAWDTNQDITIRLVHAIARGCATEPVLNAWYDSHAMALRVLKEIDLGIAVDTKEGLFVPVLRNIGQRPSTELREALDRLRSDVKARTIPPKEMQGATITLSNYGTMAGRYASPVVVPPCVAIIGAGKIREEVVAWQGEAAVHPMLPLSLTFDHRAATGGEAARFLKAMVEALQQPSVE